MTEQSAPRILVLGASGLIGRFVTDDLRRRELAVIGVARSLSDAQRLWPDDLELAIMAMDAAALAELMRAREIGVVVNCLGVLQDMLASLGYLAGCAIFTPDLWLEPLGALVKTGPAIVLMLVALLTLDNR